MGENRVIRLELIMDGTGRVIVQNAEVAKSFRDTSDEITGSIGSMTSKTGGWITKLGNKLQAMGIPFANVLTKSGAKLDAAAAKGDHFGASMVTTAGAVSAAVGVAAVGIGAYAVKAGMDWQENMARIANSADISVKKANLIGNAFLGTSFQVEFSANQMAGAYGKVGGILTTLQGHALNAKQALSYMTATSHLAEATNDDLGTATTATANILQTFSLKAKDAGNVAGILFNATRMTGVGLQQFSQQLLQVHTRLGILSPNVAQLSGLVVDLRQHGESGRASLRSLKSMMTTLIKPSMDVSQAIQDQAMFLHESGPQMKSYEKGLVAGTVTSKEYTSEMSFMSAAQQHVMQGFQQSYEAQLKAKDGMGRMAGITTFAKGKFVGFASILKQVNAELAKKKGQPAQLAYLKQVFGPTANLQMLAMVKAGPAAFAKYEAAIKRKNLAEAAARRVDATLHGQLELLKSGLENVAVRIGKFLIPKIQELGKWLIHGIQWFEKHKKVAIALGIAIGVFLAGNILIFLAHTGFKMIKWAHDGVKAFFNLGKAILHPIKSLKNLGKALKDTGDKAKASAATQMTAQKEVAGATEASNVEQQAAVNTTTGVVKADSMAMKSALIGTGIGAALVVITILLGYMLTHWKKTWATMKAIASAFWHFLDGDIIHPIMHAFDVAFNFIKRHWQLMVAIIGGPFVAGIIAVVHFRHQIFKVFTAVWHFIKRIFDDITGGIHTVANDLNPAHWLGGIGHLLGFAATGGTAMAGQPMIVGERGPEIFVPSQSGTVYPHGSTVQRGGAGGNTINITGINMANPQQVAAEVAWALKTSPSGQT